ncbi:MAG: cell division protein FtsZ, partial [Microgenomates group bacterium]
DSVLHQGVKGIAELITVAGLINVDFADVRTVMSNAGTALMGMGIGSGEKRAMAAIKQAISSPLLDVSIEGAKGILFNIVGGPDLTMTEVDEAASIIAKTVDPNADIIFGAVIDEKMMDQIKITLIATKFDEGKLNIFNFKPTLKEETTSVKREEDPLLVNTNDSPLKKELDHQLDDMPEDEFTDENEGFDIPAFLRKK